METQDHPQTAERTPRPRRIFKAVLIGIGAIVLLRLTCGLVTDYRLNSRIRAYQAAGEPILLEEFNAREPIPGGESSAVVYHDAYAGLTENTVSPLTFETVLDYPQMCLAFPEYVRPHVDANSQALALLRKARDMPRADFGGKLSSPMYRTVTFSWLSELRKLNKLAAVSARLEFQQGNHAEALELVYDLEAVAKSQRGRGTAVLISHLVACATVATHAQVIEQMAPAIGDPALPTAGSEFNHPVSRQALDALAAMLSDEDWLRESWREAWTLERAMWLDSYRCVSDGTFSLTELSGEVDSPAARRLLQCAAPLLQLDGVRALDAADQIRDAGLQPNWPAAERMASEYIVDEPSWFAKWTHPLTVTNASNMAWVLQKHFHALAMRRMAATAVALRLYELDHGARPGSLEALVPGYLKRVPLDPLAGDGRPLAYKPDATPPVLYCIGTDGIDDGGQFARTDFGGVKPESKDFVFFLDGKRPYETVPALLGEAMRQRFRERR